MMDGMGFPAILQTVHCEIIAMEMENATYQRFVLAILDTLDRTVINVHLIIEILTESVSSAQPATMVELVTVKHFVIV